VGAVTLPMAAQIHALGELPTEGGLSVRSRTELSRERCYRIGMIDARGRAHWHEHNIARPANGRENAAVR